MFSLDTTELLGARFWVMLWGRLLLWRKGTSEIAVLVCSLWCAGSSLYVCVSVCLRGEFWLPRSLTLRWPYILAPSVVILCSSRYAEMPGAVPQLPCSSFSWHCHLHSVDVWEDCTPAPSHWYFYQMSLQGKLRSAEERQQECHRGKYMRLHDWPDEDLFTWHTETFAVWGFDDTITNI